MKRAAVFLLALAALALLCAAAGRHAGSPVLTAEARQSGRSPDGLWEDVDERPVTNKFMTIIPLESPGVRTLRLKTDGLRQKLLRLARAGRTERREDLLSLPVPDRAGGGWLNFRIKESPVMSPRLAASNPQIKTFEGRGVEDPTAAARLSLSPAGFRALVISQRGTFQVQPLEDAVTALAPAAPPPGLRPLVQPQPQLLSRSEVGRAFKARGLERLYVSFFERGLARPEDVPHCFVTDGGARADSKAAPLTLTDEQPVRVYRLAVAATGQYTTHFDDKDAANGDEIEDAFRRIVETVNLMQTVYQKELGIRFELVDDEKKLIFNDAATDRYPDGNTPADTDAMLDENQRKLDDIIKEPNYDIGHVFSTQGGGLAQTGCVCDPATKAMALTGMSDPQGKLFDIDYVAHEVGHQFGARHTFNGLGGFCTETRTDAQGNVVKGTRHAADAFEPGSGSTLMSYGGICDKEDVVKEVEGYFHAASLAEIYRYVNGAGGCAAKLANADRPPTVTGGPDRVVPRGTPFRLVAAGSDPDGDALTYVWEQFQEADWNPSPAPPDDDSDGETRPLFRSFPPSASPRRTFPSMDTLLPPPTPPPAKPTFEALPTLEKNDAGQGDIAFRVTARDGRGRFAFDDVVVTFVSKIFRRSGGKTVALDVGPFDVTRPGAGATWRLGERKTVAWDVANTNLAPVGCARVRISLLLRGDEGRPLVLLDSTENDGGAEVALPARVKAGALVRVMVEAVGNVFFDVSPGDIRITPRVGGRRRARALKT